MGNDPNINEITETTEKVNPIAIYQNNIYALVDDLKQDSQFIDLSDKELKQDKAFFPRLIQYIYNNYIGELLGNKDHKPMIYKDIELLDNIFDIYIDLVYRYKWNNKPNIVEFSILTGINKNTFYNWYKNDNTDSIVSGIYNEEGNQNTTYTRCDTARKWIDICESALIDGNDTIRDIFLLKAKHGYRDNANDINITVNHKQIIAADDLPALIGLNNSNN